MNAQSLIQAQIALEYQLDEFGRLVPFPGSSEQARSVVYRHTGGYMRYFRHDLPVDLRQRLESMEPGLAFERPGEVVAVLDDDDPSRTVPVFISGVIETTEHNAELLDEKYPRPVLREGCWEIEREGKAVAWAWSERSNDQCAELAVEVDERCRRLGYGRKVSAAWADQVLASGRITFYSYARDNRASQALARSLGVVWFADCIAFD